MKKHLIAAAVAGALAVPAMAQVTVSGRIDTSIMSMEDNAGVKTTQARSSAITTNQIVLSGEEDLGGGLKANFVVASPFASDVDGALAFGDRGVLVGISGGFGSVHLGKSTSTHANGSVVTGGPLGNLTPIGNSATGGLTITRPENSITYKTPAIGGVSVQVIHSLGNAAGDTTDPATDEMTEFSLGGSFGSVKASVGFGMYDGPTGGTSGRDEVSFIASADLGMAVLTVRYLDVDQDATGGDDHTGYGVGVSIPFGSGLSGIVEYTDRDYTVSNADVSRIGLGLVKALSKRTNVYAAYYTDDEANTTLQDGNGFGVGIRHSF